TAAVDQCVLVESPGEDGLQAASDRREMGEPSKVERAAAEDGDGLCVAECLDHEAAAPVNRGLDPGSAGGDDLRAAAERGFARAAGEDNLGAAAADRCEVRERAGEDFL